MEEVLAGGTWRTRTPANYGFGGQVRFKVAGLYIAGKRVRRYFGTEAEAQTFMEAQTVRQGNLGARAAHVDGRLVEDAIECDAMLKADGLLLLDVVRDYRAARAHLKAFPLVTVAEAAQHYGALRHPHPTGGERVSDIPQAHEMVMDSSPENISQWQGFSLSSAAELYLRMIEPLQGSPSNRTPLLETYRQAIEQAPANSSSSHRGVAFVVRPSRNSRAILAMD